MSATFVLVPFLNLELIFFQQKEIFPSSARSVVTMFSLLTLNVFTVGLQVSPGESGDVIDGILVGYYYSNYMINLNTQ